MLFTPLFPSRDTPDYSREVSPAFLSANDKPAKYAHKTLVSEINVTTLEISAIICTHPEGKSWQSIFLPFNGSSLNGLSITWWNRKPGLPGQINVKAETAQQWYATVGSKVIAKGYEVLSYCGRDKGWTRSQSWCSELHARDIAIHQLAMSTGELRDLWDSNDADEVGTKIASAMVANPVISGLLRRIYRAGHLEDALNQAESITGAQTGAALALSAMHATVANLYNAVASTKGFDDEAEEVNVSSRLARKESAQAKERKAPEQTYSTWGAFG